MTAKDIFKIGDKVRMSEFGLSRIPTRLSLQERLGTVVGFNKDGDCVRVNWNGRKSVSTYYFEFLEVVR